MGGWGVGSVDTSPAFRKNLVALFRLFFFFFSIVGSCCPCPYLYRVLLA